MNNYVDVKPGNEQLLQMNTMANQLIANQYKFQRTNYLLIIRWNEM